MLDNMNRRKLCRECWSIMWLAIMLYAVQELMIEVLSVYAAKKMGVIANSALSGDTNIGIASILIMVACIAIMVIIVPVIETIAEVTMFSKSLDYCKKMYVRFAQKTLESIKEFEDGELQYKLEVDVIDFYITYTDIVVKLITLPIAYIYLFYCSSSIGLGLCATIFLFSSLTVVVKLFSVKTRTKYLQDKKKYESKYRSRENNLLLWGKQMILWDLFPLWQRKIDEEFATYYNDTEKKNNVFEVILSKTIQFVSNFGNIIILIIGAYLVTCFRMNAGQVAEMIGYYGVFIALNEKVIEYTSSRTNFNVVLEKMLFLYEDVERGDGEEIGENIHNITLRELSCGFSGKPCIEKLNYKIHNNDKLLICGSNGSGKSTLIQSVVSLRKPLSGKIYVNDRDIDTISLSSYRSEIAYVSQFPYLFSGTVFENIKIGNLSTSDNIIKNIAISLGICEILDKTIDTNGKNISGGERQKIGLARALIRKASVLIVDEPENNLDIGSNDMIREVISQYPGIVIFVSHNKELENVANIILEV